MNLAEISCTRPLGFFLPLGGTKHVFEEKIRKKFHAYAKQFFAIHTKTYPFKSIKRIIAALDYSGRYQLFK